MKVGKKALSLLLTVSMVFSFVPNSLIFATEKSSTENTYTDSAYDSGGKKDSGIPDPVVPVTGIQLSQTHLTLEYGESETLTATISPKEASDQEIAWATSNGLVCKVDETGKVTAVGNGSATITAMTYDGGFTATCKVSVITSITGITINKSKLTLAKGAKEKLIASVTPAGAPCSNINWTSSDETVCTVDSDGTVTAVNAGTAVIFAATKDSGYTAACQVTVYTPVSGISLNKTELALETGKTETLQATVMPSDATNKKVYWASSNNTVCTVDQNGKVNAIGNGFAVITATTEQGGLTAKCNVTVATRVTGITLNKTKMTLAKGTKETLIASVTPANASQSEVSWLSYNPAVCTVSPSGEVTALSTGTAVIVATTKDGAFSAACIVDVVIPATGIALNKTELTLENGKSETLTATLIPSDATNQKIYWSSSNDSVCTVSEDGKVTAVDNGSAIITVTTYDSAFTAKCNVTVKTSVKGISLNKTSMSLSKGTNETLIAAITPAGATQKEVSWFSSDTSVCTVDSTGKVTAANGGTAVIIATAKDGGYMAVCIVTVTTPVTGIRLNKTELTLENGKSEALTATVVPSDATNQEVTWTSSNDAVCTVSGDGNVTAVGNGTAVITVMTPDGKITAKCNVKVITSVTGVILNKTQLTLAKGSVETLIASVKPVEASQQEVVWASSDENICTVDSDGKVTAINAGTTEITATTLDGHFTAKCSVTVVIPVSAITLNKSELTLEHGTSEALIAAVTPADATNQRLIWKSSNSAVCTVDRNGKVTAIANGTAVITVMTLDGGLTAECNVTVYTSVIGITLNKASTTLVKGTTEKLTAAITPESASNKEVSWTSSDENVCAVDSVGNLTALNAGTADITVTTKDGGFTAKCAVTVIIPVTGISISSAALSLIRGTSETLTATVSPDDATNKAVSWVSSDETVAAVDKAGKVTAIHAGTATVTVSTEDGNYTAQCTVTVTEPVTGVRIDKTSLQLVLGTSGNLNATVLPANATDKAVTWTSTDSTIATVDQNGKVTATGVGAAAIRVTTIDGSFMADCSVTVIPNSYTVSANAVHGRVTGTGTFYTGSTVTLTAIPEEHYHFVSWTDSNGNTIGTDTTYTVNKLSADILVSAIFAINKYSIRATGVNGSVTGCGMYEYGTVVKLNAVPDDLSYFSGWSDGVTSADRMIVVTDNINLIANFTNYVSNITTKGDQFTSWAWVDAYGIHFGLEETSKTNPKYATANIKFSKTLYVTKIEVDTTTSRDPDGRLYSIVWDNGSHSNSNGGSIYPNSYVVIYSGEAKAMTWLEITDSVDADARGGYLDAKFTITLSDGTKFVVAKC